MSQLELIYNKLPAWLQDAAVTVQGARYYRQRYGGSFREEYDLLKAIEKSSASQLELLQVARLRRMLAHAAQTVPFYKSRIPAGIWNQLRAGDWTAFHSLPITEKSNLRKSPSTFLSDQRDRKGWIPWSTSGTTGSPIQLHYTPSAVSRQYAFVERYREQAGVNRFVRRAQFTGKIIVPGDHSSRFWRYDWANRALMLSTVHLNAESIPKYLEALRSFGPVYLAGYPSSIALLAKHALRNRSSAVRISTILTSAETLMGEQRDEIESAFGAKVYDQYGQTEMQSFWFECKYQRMHAHPLFGVTEILRANGSACSAGETGDVVLTGLINEAMPLIRYRIGDRASWSEEDRCPCGHSMPIIHAIDGRQEDYLYSRQRGLVGRMDPALKGLTGILECQFVQQEANCIQVLCVPDREFEASSRELLERNLRSRLGSEMQIDFQIVSHIPRGANGKFRAVVSKLPSGFHHLKPMEEVA